MIECVTLENNHHFYGNPILEQHKLRHSSIIQRQGWDVPTVRDLEYDSYDNPASYYLIKRDLKGRAVGTSRFIPTSIPYMLQEAFPEMITKIDHPVSDRIWEGSRFCIDGSLPANVRKKVMQELVVGYLEFGLFHNIDTFLGMMYPVYWKNIFIRSGWNVDWLGDIHKSDEGHKIVAGQVHVSIEALRKVREITGIHNKVLSHGHEVNETRYTA